MEKYKAYSINKIIKDYKDKSPAEIVISLNSKLLIAENIKTKDETVYNFIKISKGIIFFINNNETPFSWNLFDKESIKPLIENLVVNSHIPQSCLEDF